MENDMKKILTLCAVLIPAIALGGDDFVQGLSELSGESTTQTISDSSNQSARVQVALEVKRDAEGFLAGSEMTRALSLKLERLHAKCPDLESDELVERALDEADAVIAEQQ